MNRFIYTCILYLTLPYVPFKLFWRGIGQPAYRQHWAERFGFYGDMLQQRPLICLHCVSVGETRAAAPLIAALQKYYPQYAILLTHGTPTGRETSAKLFGQSVRCVYLPYDVPFAVNRFLRHFQPSLFILLETELWFNLIAHCKQQAIPAVLLNARLSEKSAKGYAKLGGLINEGLQNISLIAAQTSADASRFANLGVKQVPVTGSLKFDVQVPVQAIEQGQKMRQTLGRHRFVLTAASTRDGEESLILDAIAQLNMPQLMLVIVPRHPQRFAEVEMILQSRGLRYKKRSSLNIAQIIPDDIQVILGDSMGEMFTYYAASDLALIGGSLMPFGGQNLIEPCTVGVPTLVGPHTFNFEMIAEAAIVAGAVVRVQDGESLTKVIADLARHPEKLAMMKQNAFSFVQAMTGATNSTLVLLAKYLTN